MVVIGEVDLTTAPDMERVLSEVGEVDIVVDMAACEFIDSSGIAVLLRTSQTARSLILRSPTVVVRRVIDALGLSEILQIEESEIRDRLNILPVWNDTRHRGPASTYCP